MIVLRIKGSAASGRSIEQPLLSISYATGGGESTLDEVELEDEHYQL